MAVPGVLMRLVQVKGNGVDESITSPPSVASNAEAIYKLTANDDGTPSLNTLYFLSDITPIIASSTEYDEEVKRAGESADVAWVVCTFINGRDDVTPKEEPLSAALTKPQVLLKPPSPGSVIVINGSTPRSDKEQDYHDWYDQEHGGKLTLVPGWNNSRRYALAKVYGDVETAGFYGFNYYDAENGLGGPEWKAGVTEWTMRIRSNAAKPNIRRVWKVVSTS